MTIAEKIVAVQTRLAAYIKAEEYLLHGGQAYSIGNRSLTRADLKVITEMIVKLNGELMVLQRGNQIVQQRVVPRDF